MPHYQYDLATYGHQEDKEECVHNDEEFTQLVLKVGFVECMNVNDIEREQVAGLLFGVLPSFIPNNDIEAINTFLHEDDVDLVTLGDSVAKINDDATSKVQTEDLSYESYEDVDHAGVCETLSQPCKGHLHSHIGHASTGLHGGITKITRDEEVTVSSYEDYVINASSELCLG